MLWEFSATTDCKPARSMTYFRATILAKIRYCTPAWSGICSASDRARLAHVLRRSKKYGYCADDVPTTAIELFATADQSLFKRVLSNEHHVLQPLLPDKTINRYKLRPRNHDSCENVVRRLILTFILTFICMSLIMPFM